MEIMSDKKLKVDAGLLSVANTQLKKGYKQTEMGEIPIDWQVYTINQLIEENIIEKPLDGNHGNIHPTGKDYVSDGIPFVMANNIYDGILNFKNCHFIKKEQADKLQKGFSFTGDVLLTHKGTIGNTAIVGEISTDYIMLTPQVTYYRVKNHNRIINSYIRYYFDSQKFQSILLNLSGGGTRAYIGITNQKKLPFVLPSLREQHAISQILIDIDALIAKLDALIIKKRDIKQGAMQQLLTAKTCLPGFTEKWEVKKLGEITNIVSGGTPSTSIGKFWGGGIKWCTPTDITRTKQKYLLDTEKTISEYGLKNSSATLLPVGTLLLCSRATIGEIRIAKVVVCTNQGFKSLICGNNIYNEFLYYLLQLLKPKLIEKSIGSTFLEISKKDTALIDIATPSFLEQQAIAKILGDMDVEIELLEQQRDKIKLIKRGVMQELLTGKTRLV